MAKQTKQWWWGAEKSSKLRKCQFPCLRQKSKTKKKRHTKQAKNIQMQKGKWGTQEEKAEENKTQIEWWKIFCTERPSKQHTHTQDYIDGPGNPGFCAEESWILWPKSSLFTWTCASLVFLLVMVGKQMRNKAAIIKTIPGFIKKFTIGTSNWRPQGQI